MAQKSLLDIRFPLGGLDRRSPYRQQPPFTTMDALNVWPIEGLEGRERGGSRPGIWRSFPTQPAIAAPICMMATVPHVSDSGLTYWTEHFDGETVDPVWSAASWGTDSPEILPRNLDEVDTDLTVGDIVRDAFSPLIDLTQEYTVSIYIVPFKNKHHGKYTVYARMDNAAPDATDEGITVEIELIGGTDEDPPVIQGRLIEYNAGAPTYYDFDMILPDKADAGWFRVLIDGDDVTVYWQDTELASETVTAHAGQRVGVGIECTEYEGVCLVDRFRVEYYEDTVAIVKRERPVLVVSGGGGLYRETSLDTLAELTTDLGLSADRQIAAIDRGQKLYIADYGDVNAEGTDGAVNAAGTLLTAVSVANWTLLGLDAYSYHVVLTAVTGNIVAGVYEIDSIAAGGLTLTASVGGSGTCDFRVERGPKIYDPSADTLALMTTTDGSVPVGCSIIARYRDRLVFAGDPNAPHLWYMSRQGDPEDFDYGASAMDFGRATAGSVSEAGAVGEPIKAIIPFSDDYLIFGCKNSLWQLEGDAVYGGQLNILDMSVGIVDKMAWCKGPGGELIFLSNDGVYVLSPGGGSHPIPFSREKLPQELKNPDTNMYDISMAYDPVFNGVHLYMTVHRDAVAGGAQPGLHWWIDWNFKGFWPMKTTTSLEPRVVFQSQSYEAANNNVLLGTYLGVICNYSYSRGSDEGSAFESYVMYGPISLGGSMYRRGLISELWGVLDEQSAFVDWSVLVAETEESARGATVHTTGRWYAGASSKSRPRARGMSFLLKISSEVAPWAIDKIGAIIKRVGRQRLE